MRVESTLNPQTTNGQHGLHTTPVNRAGQDGDMPGQTTTAKEGGVEGGGERGEQTEVEGGEERERADTSEPNYAMQSVWSGKIPWKRGRTRTTNRGGGGGGGW